VAFERGPEAVEKIMTQQQSKSGGGGDYRRPSIFYWKDDGEKKILRFLAEDLPLVGKFANNILTNNEKIRQMEFMINPDGTNWVEHFGAMQEEYGTRAIVEPKLRTLGVGIAVLREEVPDPKSPGRTVIVDAMTTVEKDGQKFEARQYGIVKFSAYSFWNNLQGIQRRYGTLCDRDYEVVLAVPGARRPPTTRWFRSTRLSRGWTTPTRSGSVTGTGRSSPTTTRSVSCTARRLSRSGPSTTRVRSGPAIGWRVPRRTARPA